MDPNFVKEDCADTGGTIGAGALGTGMLRKLWLATGAGGSLCDSASLARSS